jgi:hypothetical protein
MEIEMTKLNTTEVLTPAQQKVGFQIHALVFVLAMIALAAIDYYTGGKVWVQWPLLGWGIGLVAHGLAVLGKARAAA